MQVPFTFYRGSHTHTYHIQRFTFRYSHSTERSSCLRQRKGLTRPALLGSPNHSPLNMPGIIPGLNADLEFRPDYTSVQLTSVRHIWMPPTMSSCLRPALSTIRIATTVPITIAAPICNGRSPQLSSLVSHQYSLLSHRRHLMAYRVSHCLYPDCMARHTPRRMASIDCHCVKFAHATNQSIARGVSTPPRLQRACPFAHSRLLRNHHTNMQASKIGSGAPK